MFGYVKPHTPELKMLENSYYRASYCGLCRVMRDETGIISRMTLSYDITFLVLIRLALTGEKPEFARKRCFLHPTRKRLVMLKCRALEYSAHVGSLLARHKLSDDVEDERSFKKISSLLTRSLFSRAYKRARMGYEDLDDSIKELLEALRKLEKEKTRSADRPAALFGQIMANVTSHGIEDGEKRLIASSIGMAVGRFIYLVDALDDIDEDRKKKSYNPFLLLFDGAELDEEKKLDIKGAMMGVISKAVAAFDLIDLEGRRDLEGVIRNILSEGLVRATNAVLFPEEKSNEAFFENGDNQ